jgi:hypothetical protein
MSESTNNPTDQQTTQVIYPNLSRGVNYTNPPKPTGQILTVAPSGISDKEKNRRVAMLGRIKNAWEVKSKEAEVAKTMHDAHGKHYQAMGAAVNAGASLVQAGTNWNRYQVAVADNRVSRAEKNAAIAAIPYEIERVSAELEKKKQALIKSETELQSAMLSNSNSRQDLIESEELSRLAGYVVTPTIPGFMKDLSGLLNPAGDISYDGQ